MDSSMEQSEKLSAQLVEWDRQLDQLRYQADSAPAAEKAGYCRDIESVQLQRRAVELQLQKIGTAGGVAWEEVKEGSDDTWNEVRTDIHDAIQNIK